MVRVVVWVSHNSLVHCHIDLCEEAEKIIVKFFLDQPDMLVGFL